MSASPPHGERAHAVRIFLILLACYVYTFPRWADWNQNSRLDLTVAIVEHGTLSIDCCVSNTGDFAYYDGHTYSDKAPGLSLLAVPVYALFSTATAWGPAERRLMHMAESDALAATLRADGTGLRADKLRFALALTAATVLIVAVPAAVLGAVMFRFLHGFTAAAAPRAIVVLAYGLGTIAFPYAGAFYAHQLVAALLFFAFALGAANAARAAAPWRLALIGALLGYAVISEYPAVLVAAPLGIYCWARTGWRARIGWLVLGALPPLALAGAYHYAIFGTPLPVGYQYSALWQERHQVGFLSLAAPTWNAFWGLTFSPYRGLFFHCPVLLFAAAGLVAASRRPALRAEAAVSAAAVLAFLVFNSASVMWWGGYTIGPRYLVPMLPFLAWPLICIVEPRRRRPLVIAAAILSGAIVWSLSLAGQHYPEETWRFPLRDYAWPHLAQGDLARNLGMVVGLRGWSSLLPLLGFIGAVAASWRGDRGAP